MSQDQLRQENIEKFNKWRSGIPDYEKRLYDRVKALNKRVVRLINVVIIGFLISFFAITLAVVFLFRLWASSDSAPASPHGDQKILSIRSFFQTLTNHQTRRLVRRQKELTRSIQQIRSYLNESDDQKDRLANIIETAEKQLETIQSEIDSQAGPSNRN